MAERGTCFSSAAILRCSSLRRLENELLIIGPAIQLLFSVFLVFTNWSSGKRSHLLLTAEGIFYFAFSLLELLSRLVAAAQQNITVFSVIDNFLAAASFLPLFFYSSFIFVFFRSQVISVLPTRFQNLVKVLFIVFIPAIIALNEVSSFIGVQRSMIYPNAYTNIPTIGIGFPANSNSQLVWSFFTSFTLAILTTYQALAFIVVFYRVIRVAINQRRIEQSHSDEAHLFRGIGFVAMGLKIGAIESVLGFVAPSFGLQMTRRLLRALSRALLCIGAAKGVDSEEDFNRIKEEMRGTGSRRSQLLRAIGNPRHSTFQHLSPTAMTFHSARDPQGTTANAESRLAGMREFTELKGSPPRERVTVHFGQGPPTLEMRFSALGMPHPDTIVEQVKSRPNTAFGDEVATLKRSLSMPAVHSNVSQASAFPAVTTRYAHAVRSQSFSSNTESTNSMAAVQDLTAQFPLLPPHRKERLSKRPESIYSRPSMTSVQTRASSQILEVPRHTAPFPSPVQEEDIGTVKSEWNDTQSDLEQSFSESRRSSSSNTMQSIPLRTRLNSDTSVSTPRARLNSDTSVSTPRTSLSRFTQPTYDSRATSFSSDMSSAQLAGGRDQGTQWLPKQPMDQLARTAMQDPSSTVLPSPSSESHEQTVLSTWHKAPRRTPTLSRIGPVRESVHLQIHPPPHHSMDVVVEQTESPSSSYDSLHNNVLRDAEAIEMHSP